MNPVSVLACAIAFGGMTIASVLAYGWVSFRARAVPKPHVFVEIALSFSGAIALLSGYVATRNTCCSTSTGIAAIFAASIAVPTLGAGFLSLSRRALIVSVVSASAAFSSGYWSLMTTPSWAVSTSLASVAAALDFVPSLMSLLLPAGSRSGFHHFFRSGTYCFPGAPWWEAMRYYRTSVVAYSLLLYVPFLIATAHKHNIKPRLDFNFELQH